MSRSLLHTVLHSTYWPQGEWLTGIVKPFSSFNGVIVEHVVVAIVAGVKTWSARNRNGIAYHIATATAHYNQQFNILLDTLMGHLRDGPPSQNQTLLCYRTVVYCLIANYGTTTVFHKLKRCKFKMSVAKHQACFTTKLQGQNLATFSHSAVTPIAYLQHTVNTK